MLVGEDGYETYQGGCVPARPGQPIKCNGNLDDEDAKRKEANCLCRSDLCNASSKVEISLIATVFASYLAILN